MTVILRWFEYSGRRHRVYFRDEAPGPRRLVVAGPGWQQTVDAAAADRLEDLGEDTLVELARRCSPGGRTTQQMS